MRTYQGSKIDQLIHEHVMGVKPAPELNIPGMRVVSAEKPAVPAYSLDIGLAMKAAEKAMLFNGRSRYLSMAHGEWLILDSCEGEMEVLSEGSSPAEVICIQLLKDEGIKLPEAA